MALPKVAPMGTFKHRNVKALGGPWDSLEFSTRIPVGERSLHIKVGEFYGYYGFRNTVAKWVSLK